jgi:minor histocompatibility antigen H13
MKYLYKTASECPKHFFIAVNVGYLIAIISTIVVMLVFDHGQPALLYLVPGCIISVLGTTFYKGEFNELWEFKEDEYITAPEEEGKEDSNKVAEADAKKEK